MTKTNAHINTAPTCSCCPPTTTPTWCRWMKGRRRPTLAEEATEVARLVAEFPYLTR